MIRVLIVDDQTTVRVGVRMWLSLQPDIEVVGEAGDGSTALPLAEALRPDVVLMDVQMPCKDGITATAALRARVPQIVVVVLSIHDDAATRERATAAGATSFVAKHDAQSVLLAAIRKAVSDVGDAG